MSEVFFQILSPLPLQSQRDARKLFEIWAETAPRFLPDRAGTHEPLRKKFSVESLDEVLRAWEFNFLLKRVAPPKLESDVFMQYGPHRDHSTWTITLQRLRDFEQSSFCNLLSRATSEFSADFGLIHYVTDVEMPRGIENGSIAYLDVQKKTKHLFVTTHHLWKYIPDIYWMTVFGPRYVDLFSREKLLSCPVHRVQELENGAVTIQLTTSLTDTVADQAGFENLRNEVRAHLNCNAIFDVKKGATHKYTVPEFVWWPLLH